MVAVALKHSSSKHHTKVFCQSYAVSLKQEIDDALNHPGPNIPHQEIVAELKKELAKIKASKS